MTNTSMNIVSNSIEDVIEKIQCLRVKRDREVVDRYNRTIAAPVARNRQVNISGNKGENVDYDDNDKRRKDNEGDEERDVGEEEAEGEEGEEEEEKEEDDRNDDKNDNLVERGPIKTQFSLARKQPYDKNNGQNWSPGADDNFSIDYEKTAEQILRDKEYSEKLNACLDVLQNVAKKTDWSCCGNESDQIGLQVSGTKHEFDLLSANDVDDPTGNLLLENVLRGTFQAGQRVSEDNGVCPLRARQEETSSEKTWSRLNIGQSPARCPPLTNGDSYSTTATSLAATIDPLVDSFEPNLRIAPSTYRPSPVSCCSSSSSSSSSNQSYGDALSPIGYQPPFTPQLEKRLDQRFESFPFWKEGSRESAQIDTVLGSIADNELWSKMFEEVLNSLEGGEGVGTADKGETTKARKSNSALGGNIATMNVVTRQYANNLYPDECNDHDDYAVAATSFDTTSPDKLIDLDSSCCPSNVSYPDFSSLLRSPTTNSIPTDHPVSLDNFENFESVNTVDDSHIPKVVAASFGSCRRRVRNSDRNIMPWPSLNLPSVVASDRLKEQLNPKEVKKAMLNLLKQPVEELARQDEDGDTMLMCLVGNPDEFVRKKAYLVPLVERLSTMKGGLAMTNNRGEDALYLAAINCPQFPYVAGYLAAAMLRKEIDVSQRLYHTRGDTLLHSVAARGDSHGEVLAELLALRTRQGNPVFDPSKRNYDGKTALHVAIESQDPRCRLSTGAPPLASVKLLLKYGSDPRVKETKCGHNALHIASSFACEPAVVKVLLDACGSDLVNATNYNHDTPLHIAAAASSNVPLKRQTEVCWLLVHAGGNTNLPNRQGKTPLALVSPDRKEAIRKVFYTRS